jgi:hypothetical protein
LVRYIGGYLYCWRRYFGYCSTGGHQSQYNMVIRIEITVESTGLSISFNILIIFSSRFLAVAAVVVVFASTSFLVGCAISISSLSFEAPSITTHVPARPFVTM